MTEKGIIWDQWVGPKSPFFLIAGPCVIESESMVMYIAEQMKEITERLNINYIFKASFDKANRTSLGSYRGVDIEEGLAILARVRSEFDIPVITDVHDLVQAKMASEVVDVLQTPSMLCRQTDFIVGVCQLGLPVNVKKGQFISPWEMQRVAEKAKSTGNKDIWVCERGYMFGYHQLISDPRSVAILKATECPVVFDATHSVQMPGAGDGHSLGHRQYVPVLARAAIANGIQGLFMETHPDPDNALSDGPNSWPLERMEALLTSLVALDSSVKSEEMIYA